MMHKTDADSDSENESLTNLKAVKDQACWDDSSENKTYSVYHDGSKPLTGDEDLCLSEGNHPDTQPKEYILVPPLVP